MNDSAYNKAPKFLPSTGLLILLTYNLITKIFSILVKFSLVTSVLYPNEL